MEFSHNGYHSFRILNSINTTGEHWKLLYLNNWLYKLYSQCRLKLISLVFDWIKKSSANLFSTQRVQVGGLAVEEQGEDQVERLNPGLVYWDVQDPTDDIHHGLQLHLSSVGQSGGELCQQFVDLFRPLL